MGLLRRIAGILGISHGGAGGGAGGGAEGDDSAAAVGEKKSSRQGDGRKGGFSVQVPVPVERPVSIGSVIVPCETGDGGVQGLGWYARRLRIDEDGDVADEFLEEASPSEASISMNNQQFQQPQLPMFQARYANVRPVIRQQTIAPEGTVRHSILHQGKLLYV